MERIKTACSKCGVETEKYFRIISDICLQEFLQGYWKSVAACGYSGTQQYRGDKGFMLRMELWNGKKSMEMLEMLVE